jgi:sterol 3beta-glucosyltransferase
MKITLLTYGSRGDVQPFLALGAGLRRAGHAVHIAAPERFAGPAHAHGMEFTALPGDVEAMTRAMVDEAGEDVMRLMAVMIRSSLGVVTEIGRQARAATHGADVVIHSFLTTAAGHSAARLNRARDYSAQVFPFFAPTGDFPQVTSPELPLGPAYNRLTHHLSHRMIRTVTTTSYRLLSRRDPAMLRPLRWPDLGGRTPVLQAYSPLVVRRPADWRAGIHQTGYWFLDEGRSYEPPPELRAFMERGPAPVVIGFSSMGSQEAQRVFEVSVAALRMLRRRGVLLGGWGMADLSQLADLGDQIIALPEVPHDWIYPRASVIVHHGGAGTMAEALRAGVPAVVVPFIADQFFWAQRAYRMGASPVPLPAAQMSAETLASAIRSADGPAIRRRAAAIGVCLRAEDGLGTAIRLIEAL